MSHDIFGMNSSDHLILNDTRGENLFSDLNIADIVTIVLGFPTNSYVIWLIVTGTGNGLAAEFFSLNLSFCDMFICLNTLLPLISDSSEVTIVTFSGQALAFMGRPLFQSLICVERYLAVVHPVTFLKFKPLRYRVICSVLAWIVISASCVIFILVFLSMIYILLFSYILTHLLFFLSFQLFCCLAVLRALKQSGPGENGREKQEENHMKRRAFKVILIITVTMVIIYTPSIISSLLFLFFIQDTDIILMITEYSYLLGGLVQPFLFLYRVGKMRITKCW